MQKSFISKFLFILLNIILFIGIISIFFIPKLYDLFNFIGIKKFSENNTLYHITFYACYIISLIIIYVLIRILKDVYLESPFKKTTVNHLKIIATLFMLLCIIIFIKTIFLPTPLSIAIIVVAFIVSLSFYVLSQVFKIAIEYKHEIDYTV